MQAEVKERYNAAVERRRAAEAADAARVDELYLRGTEAGFRVLDGLIADATVNELPAYVVVHLPPGHPLEGKDISWLLGFVDEN